MARLSDQEPDHNALSISADAWGLLGTGAGWLENREALREPGRKRPNPERTWIDLEPETQAGTKRPLYLFIFYWSLITDIFKMRELVGILGITLYMSPRTQYVC